MKFGRPWRAEKAVPSIGPETHDARERAFDGAKTDGPQKRGEIRAEGKNRSAILISRIDLYDEKYSGLCKWRRNQL